MRFIQKGVFNMYDEFDNNSVNQTPDKLSTGNFSNDPAVTEETTYYSESAPQPSASGQTQPGSYTTQYYQGTSPSTPPQPSGQPSTGQTSPSYPGYPYRPQTAAPHSNISQNSNNVKKITNRRMSGLAKAMIAVGICVALLIGVAAGSLISRYTSTTPSSSDSGSIPANSDNLDSNEKSASDRLIYATDDKDTSPLSTAEIAAKCGPSVVEIRTEMVITGSWMQQYITEGAGSGVILTEDGYIVTNNHVIEGASKITVTLQNGTSYDAKLIGTDERADIALIKVETTGLTPAVIGDSDKLVVGEKAVAIGNPLGELGGTVTDGIVSALDREITIDGVKMSLLQTNAAINPGNSGGGLFDGSGNLIAIVDAKSSGEGIEGLGFAIPVNDMTAVVDQLMSYGYVRGYTDTGMTFIDITDMLTAMQYRVNTLGVYVLKVSGDKALEAGFQSGDLITKVDGKEISSSADIDSIVSQHSVGDQIAFEVYRSRGTLTLTLTLDEYVPEGVNA